MRIESQLVEEVLDQVSTGRIEPSIAGVGAVEGTARVGRIETPYLQLVLQRLWEVERGRGSEIMRLETFRSLGGAERIVQDHLERALRSLSAAEQAAAASVFGHLVTPSGTKIAHGTSDLATYASLEEREIKPVLDSLARQRILRPLGENGHAGGRYEIFHDVLAGAVLAWSTRHEADAALEEERNRRKRLGWLAAAALVGLLLMAGLAAYAFSQRSEAQTQTELAQTRSGDLEQANDDLQQARADAETKAAAAIKAEDKANQEARKAKAAEEKATHASVRADEAKQRAKQQAARAEIGETRANEAEVAARHEAEVARHALQDAKAQRTRADKQRRNAEAATETARAAQKNALYRAYIARSVLLGLTDPEESARFAVQAAGYGRPSRRCSCNTFSPVPPPTARPPSGSVPAPRGMGRAWRISAPTVGASSSRSAAGPP
jgi:chemotaxis protein histidine kinase CheA